MTLNITHTDGDGADDIEGIAKASCDYCLVGCRRCWERTAEDCQVAVGFEKGELFDKTRVAEVDETGKGWASLRHGTRESGSLFWVRGVGIGKAVEISFGGSVDSELANGWWGDGSVGDGHGGLEGVGSLLGSWREGCFLEITE